MGTSLKEKNLLPEGAYSFLKEFSPRSSEFFPLRAVPYGMKITLPHWVTSLECCYLYYAYYVAEPLTKKAHKCEALACLLNFFLYLKIFISEYLFYKNLVLYAHAAQLSSWAISKKARHAPLNAI